jgi:hypothetical protein
VGLDLNDQFRVGVKRLGLMAEPVELDHGRAPSA